MDLLFLTSFHYLWPQMGNIYAGTDFGGGVFRSDDNGDTWVNVTNGFTSSNGVNALGGSDDQLFAGTYGDGIFRTDNDGDNWIQVNNGLTMPLILSLAAGDNGQMYAGAYFGGGFWVSTDSGNNWTRKINMLIATEVRAIVDGFAGTYGSGIFRTENYGDSWTEKNNGLTGRFITSLAYHGSAIFAGTDMINNTGGIYRSTDMGESWENVFEGISPFDIRALVSSGNTIFAGSYGDGVFRSTDNGDTWQQVNNGLTCTYLWSLAVNDQGHIFAGTAGCNTGIYRSTNNGDSWELINNGLTTTDVSAILCLGNGVIYAGTTPVFGVGGGVYRSEDNGSTWSEFNEGLTNLEIRSLAYQYVFLYVATPAGISVYGDPGWVEVSFEGVQPLVLAAVSFNLVLAGTMGNGVWKEDVGTGIDESFVDNDITVFPNPSSAEIQIMISDETYKELSYSVISAAGQFISGGTINQNPTKIDVKNWDPGLYCIAITDGKEMVIKKVVIE